MKESLIKAGSFYSDGSLGIREVLSVGVSTNHSGVQGASVACVHYRVVHAVKGNEIGIDKSMTLTSFATWAKSEITKNEADSKVIVFTAAKLEPKLSPTHRQFLEAFDSDLTTNTLSSCTAEEYAAANACFKKGFLQEAPPKKVVHYDVSFTELGLAVLALVKSKQASKA